jgi:hypothetical protein
MQDHGQCQGSFNHPVKFEICGELYEKGEEGDAQGNHTPEGAKGVLDKESCCDEIEQPRLEKIYQVPALWP